jgi:hypothetical protein
MNKTHFMLSVGRTFAVLSVRIIMRREDFQERGQLCPRVPAAWVPSRGQSCPRSFGCGFAALCLGVNSALRAGPLPVTFAA